ncbi:MAG: hypothetical protein LBE24_04825 [Methylobacillus sp.]|nr:hypothetical protein [Methylobacillus sp.]
MATDMDDTPDIQLCKRLINIRERAFLITFLYSAFLVAEHRFFHLISDVQILALVFFVPVVLQWISAPFMFIYSKRMTGIAKLSYIVVSKEEDQTIMQVASNIDKRQSVIRLLTSQAVARVAVCCFLLMPITIALTLGLRIKTVLNGLLG